MVETICLEDPAVVVRLHRSARARRFTLTLRHGREARLTAPSNAGAEETRRFLERHRGWLRDALTRAPAAEVVAVGIALPINGAETVLRLGQARQRGCRLVGDVLLVPPLLTAGPAVAAYLRARAQSVLVPAAQSAAARLGREIRRISLRDTRSRWGSCTAQGNLMFSWRLAMAPPEVQLYVASHEAAHLVEMNHGPRFWQLVERLSPDWRARRNWLRKHGPSLHRYSFDAAT